MDPRRRPLALVLALLFALVSETATADSGVTLAGLKRDSAISSIFPVANGVEARVAELAAAGVTVCGEPLNGPETAEGGTLEDGDQSAASDPATQCWGRGPSYDTFNTDGGIHAMTAVSNWGSAQYALAQGAGYIWLRGLQSTAIGAGNKTVCQRYYKRVPSPGYGSAGGQFGVAAGLCAADHFWRNKLSDFYFTGNLADPDAGEVQLQEDPYYPGEDGNCYSNGTFHPMSMGRNNSTQVLLSPRIDLSACGTKPCRVEMCAAGSFSTGQNITLTAYVTPVATGVTSTATLGPINFDGGPTKPWLTGGNLYRGEGPGSSLHNFYAQAVWNDTNPHTIGAAVEVEGGGGDTTPPATPTSLSGTPGDTTVALSWSHPNTADVDEFVVEYRCPSGSGSYVELSPRSAALSRTVTGLTNGATCDFRVAAEDVSNNRSAYASTTATPSAGSPTFPVASGVEQRCTDLGADCLCSEPMNTNENGGAGLTDQWDFASSSNATECGQNRSTANSTVALANPTLPIMVAVSNWGSAGYALRSGSGAAWFTTGRRIDQILSNAEKQVCWRWYKRVSSDYGNTCDVGGGQRNKIGQSNFTGGLQNNQPEEINCSQPCSAGSNYCPIINGNDIFPPGGGWGEADVPLSPVTTWEAFKAKPARIEYCLDSRDAAGVKGGNRLTWRLRVKRLDTGVISRADTPETTGWGAPTLWDAWGNDEDHTGPGNGFMNFFIHTKSNTSPDVQLHWPGCSPEVEGTVLCPVAGGD